METVVTEQSPQRMRALAQANATRKAAMSIKRDVKAGRITFAAALVDDRAGSLTVLDLLMAQNRWGRQRALRAISGAVLCDTPVRSRQLVPVFISESRRICDLTPRQRSALVTAVTGDHRRAA